MIKFNFVKLYILVVFIFNSFCLLSANQHTIIVGIQLNAPPFEYVSNDKLIGFNIDILNSIGKRLPLEYVFVQKSYSQLKNDLINNEIDMILMMYKSDDNFQDFHLSETYNSQSVSVFLSANAPFSIKSINQYELCTDIPEICQLVQESLSVECKIVEEKLRRDFFSNQECSDVEYFVMLEKTGLHLIEKNGLHNIWSYPMKDLRIKYGFGFNKNNDSLFLSINENLSYLINSGEYEAIQQKWFGLVDPDIINKPSCTNPIYNYFFILAILLIACVAYALLKQNKKLKAEIEFEKQQKQKFKNELEELKFNLNLTINAIQHPLFLQNSSGVLILYNDAFLNLIGVSKEICTFDKINEVLENDDQFKKLLLIEQGFLVKQKIIDASGQLRVFEISKTIYQKSDNESVTLTFALDISKRDKAERKLEHESALLSSIINSIPDYLYYKDNLFRYIGANTAFKKYHNLSDEEFVGKTDFELFDIKQAIESHNNDKKIIKNDEPIRIEKWGLLPNGKSALLDVLMVPFHNNDGETLGIVGISRDITHQYEIQKELKDARAKAEDSDKLKTVFLANISHEIRTPLNSIIGFSDLLLDHDLSFGQRENFIEMIRNSGNSLVQLVDDIIDLSKIESGQIVINLSEIKISGILNDVFNYYDEILNEPDYNDVKLINNFVPSKNESSFYLDGFRIKQVLSNLIGNAIKYTRKGKIEVGAYVNDDYIEFYVDDRNAIIDNNLLENIFQRNAFSGGIENYGGSGLNLIISQGLIKAMKGDILVNRSKDGNGIKFSFIIPFTKQIAQTYEDNIQINAKDGFNNKTILIAEDEENNYLFIEEILHKTGIKIIWALNGKEALEYILANKEIDIVLMDIRMPVMDGYTATLEIRKIRPDIPIIAQTAYAASEEKSKSIEVGCNAYLTKPISSLALLKTISDFI